MGDGARQPIDRRVSEPRGRPGRETLGQGADDLLDERDRAADLLDGLRGQVDEARSQAADGDLTGALATPADSTDDEAVQALDDLTSGG